MNKTVGAALATPLSSPPTAQSLPDGYPLRWRDVTDDMVHLGFPQVRCRYLEVCHFDANDERRWSIVTVDEDCDIATVVGAELDEATWIALAYDLRHGERYQLDLTIAQEFERAAKIAKALGRTLHGEAA